MSSSGQSPDPDEIVLADDPHRRVVRIGDTIRRPLEDWSDSVHALLDHLHDVGFEPAPRFLGVDSQGREILSAIDGASGPQGWAEAASESGLVAMAQLLRRYHDAVASFDATGLTWAGADDQPPPDAVVCHGDFGPWNLVWNDGVPTGVIDWDYAWPKPPLHDIAYALEYVAPFRDDRECLQWLAYDHPPNRERRMMIFAEAYGLPNRPGLLEDLIDAVIDQQRLVLARAAALADAGHQPQVDWVAAGHLTKIESQIAWSEGFRARRSR